MFLQAEGRFYHQAKGTTHRAVVIPQMEKFSELWTRIWEGDKKTEETEWMREVGRRIRNKVTEVNKFSVTVVWVCVG